MPITKTKKLTPKRRFPEFRDAPGWPSKPLKHLAKRKTDRNSDEQVTRVLTNSAEHGIVDQRDYFDKDIANSKNLGNYFIVDEGDYVYNPRISTIAPVGPISRNELGKGVMSPLYTVFRFTSEENAFYAQYFKANHWHQYMKQVSNTGARHDRMSITNDDFMRMPMPYPGPAEQQKIAECLGSLDDLIAAAGRKLAALRDHRRGLLQQLFPRPGQSQPQQRFPEFRKAGKWVETRLKKFFPCIRNGFVGTATPFYVEDGIPYLQGKNIKAAGIDPAGLVTISTEFHERQKKSQLKLNDLLMVQSGHVGECAVVTGKYVGANCHALIILSCDVNPCSEFFLYLFYSSYGMHKIAEITTGNTIKHILASGIKAMKIHIPETDERKKIAACLTALDTQITAQAAQLDALHGHKHGLMQQLFPSPEEEV